MKKGSIIKHKLKGKMIFLKGEKISIFLNNVRIILIKNMKTFDIRQNKFIYFPSINEKLITKITS